MHQHFRALSLLGIFSLTLLSLAGCGEKRIHVSTASGAPGDEIAMAPLEPIDDMALTQSAGLGQSGVDESSLSSLVPDSENTSDNPPASTMDNEPINMAHESTSLSAPEAAPSDGMLPSLESELADNTSPLASLAHGQDLSTQSSSSSEGPLTPYSDQSEASQKPSITQDFSTGLKDTLSGEDLEPVPDTFQIAKAEPSGSHDDQMNRIKAEELATAAAGLEDVFFQFDSWTLTQEGKHTLERTAGWFTQDPSSNLIIEGHTDQRGTQAYNMILAKKRAVAVQEYLSQLGVEPSRLAIISYGKDKPFCQEATEVCHQLNRRGHLLVKNP